MPVVLGSRQAQRALGLLAAAATAAGVAAGGCGSAKHGPASSTTAARPLPTAHTGGATGNPSLGNPRLVDCQNWRAGGDGERYGTIRELRGFAGSPSGGAYAGATMPDKKAYQVLEGWCRQSYATYFKLYKLYLRAVAFTPHP